MTTITVTRTDQGVLDGLGEKDKRAYALLKKKLAQLEAGECMTVSVWFDRNPKLHALHFVMLSAAFDAQEQFDTLDAFRYWVTCGAGHCTFAPGPSGKMVAIPRSIAWDRLDEAEFREYHRKAIDFLRSPRASQFLWPNLNPQDQSEMVEIIFGQFDDSRAAA